MNTPTRFRFPLIVVAWLSVLGPTAHAGDDLSDLTRGQMPAVVQEEYGKMEHQLQGELSNSQARIKALQTEKDGAAARAAELAKTDEIGIKLMKDFDSLLHAKYVDKKGHFLPGFEVASADVDNLNGVFLAHLSMTPLSGHVSAGQAHKQIAWGLDRLDEVMKAHRDPSEGNNSDFEIIGKQVRDEEARSEKINSLAEILGLKLDPALPPAPEATRLGWSKTALPSVAAAVAAPTSATRAPASVKAAAVKKKATRKSDDEDN